MDFLDIFSRAAQNRMDQATQPFTDPMGYVAGRFGVTDTETEEEKKKRLLKEAAERGNTEVASTTVKSYADGSKEEVKKTQIPAPAPEAAPAPVQTAVPANMDTYQKMLQAESGNRQLGPNGQILTSPKGALGVGQVMPTTAMQPGYGVPSIFDMAAKQGMPVETRDEATAKQLLANEQLNRQFSQAYYNGMQNRFPGNEQAAVAAYNGCFVRFKQSCATYQVNLANSCEYPGPRNSPIAAP